MQRFKDKVVAVTGAARGIGQAIALRFAQEGAQVALFDVEDSAEAAELCREAGASVLAMEMDVTQKDSILSGISQIVQTWGNLDIWVNNAGVFDDTPLVELDESRWDRVNDVNSKGMYLCAQQACRLMMAQQWGRIINISSMAGKVPFPDEAAYSASKSAVLGLTRALAAELGPEGVTVNAVCPGPIETKMLDETYQRLAARHHTSVDNWRSEVLETIPVNRFGQPEDVAALVAFLASEEASFINGQAINVDGGLVSY